MLVLALLHDWGPPESNKLASVDKECIIKELAQTLRLEFIVLFGSMFLGTKTTFKTACVGMELDKLPNNATQRLTIFLEEAVRDGGPWNASSHPLRSHQRCCQLAIGI